MSGPQPPLLEQIQPVIPPTSPDRPSLRRWFPVDKEQYDDGIFTSNITCIEEALLSTHRRGRMLPYLPARVQISPDPIEVLQRKYPTLGITESTNVTIEEGSLFHPIIVLSSQTKSTLGTIEMKNAIKNTSAYPALSLAIEEISHYHAIMQAREENAPRPHSAALELKACLDKYNVMQYLSHHFYGEELKDVNREIFNRFNLSALHPNPNGIFPNHIIGHRFGAMVIDHFDELYDNSDYEAADAAFKEFCEMDSTAQLKFVNDRFGDKLPLFNQAEYDAVKKIFDELGLELKAGITNN